MDDLTAAVESNKCADILFFDVSNAFDSVNLDLLIQKISNFGIGNSTITWLQNCEDKRPKGSKRTARDNDVNKRQKFEVFKNP